MKYRVHTTGRSFVSIFRDDLLWASMAYTQTFEQKCNDAKFLVDTLNGHFVPNNAVKIIYDIFPHIHNWKSALELNRQLLVDEDKDPSYIDNELVELNRIYEAIKAEL